jgi:hypothetical protein
LSGSLTGVATNVMALQEYANVTFVANTTFAPVTGITSALTRFRGTRPIDATGGADRVSVRWGHAIVSGTSYNYTVRIASPQLEKGSVATPVIRTASGFVTVDMLGVARDGAPPDFTFTRATTATRVNASGLIESVASGFLRLDYPIGGGCPAALIEPAATNLAWHSETWATGTNWNLTNNVTTATGTSGTLDPLGTNTANAISPTSASGTHFLFSNVNTLTYVSGTIYTKTAFFKQGTGDAGRYVQLSFVSSRFTQLGYANFDLQLGTVAVVSGTSADTNRAASIENYGNGWYRCRFTATCSSGGQNAGVQTFLITASGDTRSPSFTGVTGDILYGWGAQMETGAIPTSYIPTTTGQATRNADVCSVSGVSGYIGQTEGTIYVEVDVRNFVEFAKIFAISDGTTGNRVALFYQSNNRIRFAVNESSSAQVGINTSTLTAGVYKIAGAYKQNDFAFYVNGSLIDTDTSGNVPACSQVFLGKLETSTTSSADFLNDRIRAAAIYTTRLTNDQLASLTRLT